MSYRRPYGSRGLSQRGRSGNAYERENPSSNGRDLYEGLNKESTEVISTPTLNYRTPGQDIQPKDLTYIGSYNWVEETVPTIIVPGKSRRPATLSATPPHFLSWGSRDRAHLLTRFAEGMDREAPPDIRSTGPR